MNFAKCLCLANILTSALIYQTGSAQSTSDLSNGVAYPSFSSALYENTAALGVAGEKGIELGIFFNGQGPPESGTATYIHSFGSTGLGLGTFKNGTGTTPLSFGLGQGLGSSFRLGVGLTYQIETQNLAFDIGTLFEMANSLVVGLVFYSIDPLPASWSIGFAKKLQNEFTLEWDFRFSNRTDSFEPVSGTSLLGFTIRAQSLLSLRLGYIASVYPALDLGNGSFELGLNYWFSQNASVYFVMNDHLGPRYRLGMLAKF